MKWNRRATYWNVGLALKYFSGVVAALLPVSLVWGEFYALPGVGTAAVVTLLIGVGFQRRGDDVDDSNVALNFASAAAVWLVVGLLSALPFLLVAWTVALAPSLTTTPPLSPTLSAFQSPVNAVFEAMSGITGAGLTVTRRESQLPATLQFWRSLLQWVGGIGIVVLLLSVFVAPEPLTGYYETEIPVGQLRLQPADPRAMLVAFSVATLASIAALWALGLSWWAAINHGLTAISTGGFTITDASIAVYSLPVQAVLTVIMAVGAIPVPVYFLALRGDLREFYVDLQSRWLWVALAAGSLIVTGLLVVDGPYQSVWNAVQYGTFQFVSAMTCAGFATALNIGAWPSEALFVMTLGMFVGGGLGSTASGIKVIRAATLIRGTWFRVTNVFFPGGDIGFREAAAGETSHIGSIQTQHAAANYDDASFVTLLWLGTFVVAVFVIAAVLPDQVALENVLFDVASALSAVGLTTGITDVTMPATAKLMLIFTMWVGRLEVFPALVLLRGLVGADESQLDVSEEDDD